MSAINWEAVWKSTLENKQLFPFKANDKSISLSCPTRFNRFGEFSITITPSFSDDSIVLEMLVFNDNVSPDELNLKPDENIEAAYNLFVNKLIEFELSNRIMERYKILTKGFNSDKEAENTLVDYLNNKATENGRMFDDKLDELNDSVEEKEESYAKYVRSIKESRFTLMSKVCEIIASNFNWKASKNESFDDSVIPLYNCDGVMKVVVSLSDGHIVIDLSRDITSVVDVNQSDEDIEACIVDDINNALAIDEDDELEQLNDIVVDNHNDLTTNYPPAEEDSFDAMNVLESRVAKLESLYIRQLIKEM